MTSVSRGLDQATEPPTQTRPQPIAAGWAGMTTAQGRIGPKPGSGDSDWPRTGRLLPWLLAAFLVMIYVVPFDDVQLPVRLPIESTPDRFFLPLIALLWLAVLLAGVPRAAQLRANALNPAMLAFFGLVGLGLVLNYGAIVERGEFTLAVKKLSILLGYALFFYIAVSVVRANELRAFGRLLVGLGCVLAAGLVYQYLSGVNLFQDITRDVFGLAPSPSRIALPTEFDAAGRRPVAGPARHGVVASTLLAISVSFAALELQRSRTLARRLVYMLAFGAILAGGFATARKSSAVLPLIALMVFMLANPRAIKSVIPVIVISLGIASLLAPGAAKLVVSQLDPARLAADSSTQSRLSDYALVVPDVEAKSALGRGYGTFDAFRYRLLDNQYLTTLVETGVLGLIAYLGLILSVLGLALAARLKAGQDRGPPAAALLAATAALAAANSVYDLLGFPHAGYILFFIAAMAVVAAGVPREEPEPEPDPSYAATPLGRPVLQPVVPLAPVTPLRQGGGFGRGAGRAQLPPPAAP